MPFWYIIANPVSGGGSVAKRWPHIEQLLQELGFSYTVQFTEHRGHAIRLAQDAVLRGHRNILGIGGDGTNNEILNGIFTQTTVPTPEICYSALPVGTGNDWARQYQIPADPRARLLRLREDKTVLQDIGWVQYTRDGQTHERYFMNVAGLAYDGFIGSKLEGERSKITNRLQYLVMVAQYLLEYKLVPASLQFDGKTVEDYFYTINVGLCKYSGGGMQLVPHAVPDDGLLALTFARRIPKYEVMLLTPKFYNGSILSHPQVEGYSVKEVQVDTVGPVPTLLEADGEFLGETPASFRILEKALRVGL